MKITRRQLKQIIKEEVSRLNEFWESDRPAKGTRDNEIATALMASPLWTIKPFAAAYFNSSTVRDATNPILVPLWEDYGVEAFTDLGMDMIKDLNDLMIKVGGA